jgi:hypothetical protein
MKIALKDFRAFTKTNQLDVRPMTFLVGENSSGKTSLLAALAYAWRFKDRSASLSFNSAPFDLGSFDEIVHRTKGRPKPDEFQLEVSAEMRPSRTARTASMRRRSAPIEGEGRIILNFSSALGQVTISNLRFSYSHYSVDLRLGPSPRLEVYRGADKLSTHSPKQEELFSPDLARHGRPVTYAYINLLITEFLYASYRKADRFPSRPSQIDELSTIFYALDSTINAFPTSIYASAPVRSSPNRVYTPVDQTPQPDGTHAPYDLNRIKSSDPQKWSGVKKGLEDFGKASGMFSRIDISKFRKDVTAPFQIKVNVSGRDSNLVDVGYGVSQALPIVSDMLESRDNTGFLLQQPEVHLHPRAQAALASFFVEHLVANPTSTIVAETHSDYMIDRVRIEIREGRISKNDVSILYFEQKGTYVDVHQISMDAAGNICDPPSCYRDFFLSEQRSLLGL